METRSIWKIGVTMENEIREIEDIVRKYGDVQSLMHYINVKTLRLEHEKQRNNKAAGIDKITKEKYDIRNLDKLIDKIV